MISIETLMCINTFVAVVLAILGIKEMFKDNEMHGFYLLILSLVLIAPFSGPYKPLFIPLFIFK